VYEDTEIALTVVLGVKTNHRDRDFAGKMNI